MSRLSALDAQKKWATVVKEGHIVTGGLTTCEYCHDATTRVRTAASGVTLCVRCLESIQALRDAPACPWVRPKGARVTKRSSSEEYVLFVDGAFNGMSYRRGSKMGQGKKKTLVLWSPSPLLKMDGCWYLYDPIDDVYHHACP